MKKADLMLAGVVMGWVSGAVLAEGSKVSICIAQNISVRMLENAQIQASRIFNGIGVKLDWHHAESAICRTSAEGTIFIGFSENRPAAFQPGAFAYALPYEGVHIEVLYNRLRVLPDPVFAAVLAHVLAHEITHILQGMARHSESGVMKARWEPIEMAQMQFRPLGFTDWDVRLIRDGLKARANAGTAAIRAGHAVGDSTANADLLRTPTAREPVL